MNVIDAFNSRLHLPGYQELEIVSIYEDVYDNQVHIKVRKLTPEKEEAIRNIVDSPCMVISDSASKVIESPLAEEDINQIPGANMSIVENSVTPTSLTVVFSYTGKGKMKYGPENYLIERYDKDEKKWYRITDYREAITLVEQVVCAGEYVEETYDWEWAYDVLPEGHYRILIDCSYYVDDEEQGSTYLVEEFYVE